MHNFIFNCSFILQYTPCHYCFKQLIKELHEAFKPRGLVLSAAVTVNTAAVYEIAQMAPYLDWMSLMSYYNGTFNGRTRHHSPIYATNNNPSIDSVINYFIERGASSRKLILGIPSYGISFKLTDENQHGYNSSAKGPGQAGPFTRTPGTLAYYEICDKTKWKEWTVVRDPTNNIGPYAYSQNQWVSFDDVDNVRAKAKYIQKMNLGGGMIWTLDYDDYTNSCGCGYYPLLTALNFELHRTGGRPIHNCA